jgi:diguanylate cyclase (GGDEF)-like protein
VLFVDLDKFKDINDSYGHAAGDAALQHPAAALRGAARAEDTVARLGGDEFVVLCAGVNRKDARNLAERMITAISTKPAGDVPWRVSGSIGMALADRNAHPSQTLSAADAALYRAKTAGPDIASE